MPTSKFFNPTRRRIVGVLGAATAALALVAGPAAQAQAATQATTSYSCTNNGSPNASSCVAGPLSFTNGSVSVTATQTVKADMTIRVTDSNGRVCTNTTKFTTSARLICASIPRGNGGVIVLGAARSNISFTASY